MGKNATSGVDFTDTLGQFDRKSILERPAAATHQENAPGTSPKKNILKRPASAFDQGGGLSDAQCSKPARWIYGALGVGTKARVFGRAADLLFGIAF